MNPFSPDSAGAAGSLGGLRRSRAQRDALDALHAARRGKRHRERERWEAIVLAALLELVRDPRPGVRSIRVVAQYCGVSDRTVRRWLSGEDWPPIQAAEALRAWVWREKRRG